jgi:GT2 family glycosyltransferase
VQEIGPEVPIATIRPIQPQATPPVPLVSIVIPTFNHLDLLKGCVESLIRFTDMARCEVVIVANGCTDGTVGYLQTLPVPFRYVVHDQPLGYTAATNAGIREAFGEYVVLLNNDVILLEQEKNTWIELLLAPFKKDTKVGITGPVKFRWDCAGIERRAIAFWCATIPRRLFQELGLLDEIFSPGMGEDGDFSIKAEQAGYRLVQVPEDGSEEFGKGIPNQKFPIYHAGSGTFGDRDYSEIKKRNDAILVERYGRKDNVKKDDIDVVYQLCLTHASDTNDLFPTFRSYARECAHVTEFGVRGVFTTWAFLAGRPKRMISYDIEYNPNIEGAKKEALRAEISFEFRQENTLETTIEPTDLLFIDTTHTYLHLKVELERHAGKVGKWIMIHDSETFGETGQDGTSPGEKAAITEFLVAHPEWIQKEHMTISNGLTILERKTVAVSIIIPTAHHFADALHICLEAVLRFTDLSDKEIIVVPNGSPKEALEYLKTKPVRIFEFPEPIGYIRAVNAGIREARGERVVLLDDDSFLLGQHKDEWIRILSEPFKDDPKMGAAGPFGQTYEDLGQVLHSGCTMYKTSVLREIGLFDEAFNPGYMGDEDLAIRIRKAGYHLQEVPKGGRKEYVNGVFEIQFPVLHTGTVATMPKHTTDLPLVKKNRDLLLARHGTKTWPGASGTSDITGSKEPKVSIIIPTAFAKLEELLKPNLQSLIQYTDLSNVEVIVVCNGCTDGAEDYVKSLGTPFKVLSYPDALGFTRATNEGLKVAQGDYLILYNNDNMLLGQPKNRWIEQLLAPFKDNPKMGITGPLQLHDDYADQDVIIGFCLCISKKVMQDAMADTAGFLDEAFSPGGGEDIDLCCKVRAKGYVVRQVPDEGKLGFSHTNTGDFMIWHRDNQTFKDIPEYTRYYVKRNGWINCKRYNKNIKLNLGSGGIEYPGFLSVDLHDRRATIIMDATKIDFEENSVSEIMASHLFEHISPFKALDTLKLWNKVLKPGGRLVMEMPDMENLCKKFLESNTGQRYGVCTAIYGAVNTSDSGDPNEISSPHLYGWWPQSIADHLYNAGFIDIKFGKEIWPHPEPPNLHVEATKPLK